MTNAFVFSRILCPLLGNYKRDDRAREDKQLPGFRLFVTSHSIAVSGFVPDVEMMHN